MDFNLHLHTLCMDDGEDSYHMLQELREGETG